MIQAKVVKDFDADKWLKKFIRKSDLNIIARGAVTLIKQRAATGNDMNDKAFMPYSPAYWEWKQSRGRSRKKHGGSSHVNLMLHGHMLQALKVRSVQDGYELFFLPDQVPKAMAHQFGLGNLPKREFFGLPNPEWKRLFDGMVRKVLQRAEGK